MQFSYESQAPTSNPPYQVLNISNKNVYLKFQYFAVYSYMVQ
jgi:hypothetical protein